jgi:hypothetical protein
MDLVGAVFLDAWMFCLSCRFVFVRSLSVNQPVLGSSFMDSAGFFLDAWMLCARCRCVSHHVLSFYQPVLGSGFMESDVAGLWCVGLSTPPKSRCAPSPDSRSNPALTHTFLARALPDVVIPAVRNHHIKNALIDSAFLMDTIKDTDTDTHRHTFHLRCTNAASARVSACQRFHVACGLPPNCCTLHCWIQMRRAAIPLQVLHKTITDVHITPSCNVFCRRACQCLTVVSCLVMVCGRASGWCAAKLLHAALLNPKAQSNIPTLSEYCLQPSMKKL